MWTWWWPTRGQAGALVIRSCSFQSKGLSKLLVGTPLEQLDELMEQQISTNLLGSLRCAVAAAQVMASDGRGGRVCIVSSAAGLISLPGTHVLANGHAYKGYKTQVKLKLGRNDTHFSYAETTPVACVGKRKAGSLRRTRKRQGSLLPPCFAPFRPALGASF